MFTVLLVGCADFADARLIIEKHGVPGEQILASEIRNRSALSRDYSTFEENIQYLQEQGAKVCLEIDALNLINQFDKPHSSASENISSLNKEDLANIGTVIFISPYFPDQELTEEYKDKLLKKMEELELKAEETNPVLDDFKTRELKNLKENVDALFPKKLQKFFSQFNDSRIFPKPPAQIMVGIDVRGSNSEFTREILFNIKQIKTVGWQARLIVNLDGYHFAATDSQGRGPNEKGRDKLSPLQSEIVEGIVFTPRTEDDLRNDARVNKYPFFCYLRKRLKPSKAELIEQIVSESGSQELADKIIRYLEGKSEVPGTLSVKEFNLIAKYLDPTFYEPYTKLKVISLRYFCLTHIQGVSLQQFMQQHLQKKQPQAIAAVKDVLAELPRHDLMVKLENYLRDEKDADALNPEDFKIIASYLLVGRTFWEFFRPTRGGREVHGRRAFNANFVDLPNSDQHWSTQEGKIGLEWILLIGNNIFNSPVQRNERLAITTTAKRVAASTPSSKGSRPYFDTVRREHGDTLHRRRGGIRNTPVGTAVPPAQPSVRGGATRRVLTFS